MKFADLVALVGNEPVFASSLLLVGKVSSAEVRLQLSRWVATGKLLQLRRGLYALAPTWRKVEPHPFLVANALQRGSYVSQQSALAFHGIIPEHVPVVTSVGPRRPETIRNRLGTFQFRHVASRLLYGYTHIDVAPGQYAFVAEPEKALLDLVYLTSGGDSPDYLHALRLQQVDAIHPATLLAFAEASRTPRLIRAAHHVLQMVADETGSVL